jgi:hypothetical protein
MASPGHGGAERVLRAHCDVREQARDRANTALGRKIVRT